MAGKRATQWQHAISPTEIPAGLPADEPSRQFGGPQGGLPKAAADDPHDRTR
jgi:hypothetical protein